jgi:hypothetical protein
MFNLKFVARFQVLMAVSMKMAVLWIVPPLSLIEVYRHFRGACCLHYQGKLIALMMEAASTSETLVNFYETKWHNNPDSHLFKICRIQSEEHGLKCVPW